MGVEMLENLASRPQPVDFKKNQIDYFFNDSM